MKLITTKENTVNAFFINDDKPWDDLGDGFQRKIVGYTDELMRVDVFSSKRADFL